MSQQDVDTDRCSWRDIGAGGTGDGPEGVLAEALRLDGGVDRVTSLLKTVEGEIIPRLMLARRGLRDPRDGRREGVVVPTDADVATFADLALKQDPSLASGFVERMRQSGAPVDMIYLDLLAPAARRLGAMWEADLCDFVDVTVGLGRIHNLLRTLNPAFNLETAPREIGRRALVVPAPGEQHTFGVVMVAEFFRRAGWDLCGGPMADLDGQTAILRDTWVDLVGLSASCDDKLDAVRQRIAALRRASRNPNLAVMVGGRVFTDSPNLVSDVGADLTATDARKAAVEAERLIAPRTDRIGGGTA